MKLQTRLFLLIGLLFLPIFQAGAFALPGDLGLWVRNEAGPRLAELIKHQPRFIGETIDIVALKQGKPIAIDSALTESISNEIRQVLLKESNIRMPLALTDDCQLTQSHIVVGIEIDRSDRMNHRVLIALLDLEENIWINQSPQNWTGRLTTEQSRLLARPAKTRTRKFDPDDVALIARALDEQLQCRSTLAQPVFIEAVDDKLRSALLARLTDYLQVTGDEQAAASKLTLTTDRYNAVNVILGDGRNALTLATAQLLKEPAPARLLTEISVNPRKVECRGHGKHCIDIGYEILEDAYVFEFFTRQGRLVSLDCALEPDPDYGPKRKGLKVPPANGIGRPSLGFYVLATGDPSVARMLATDLRDASQHCGGDSGDQQMQRLATLIADNDVSWQAIHLTNHQGRIRTL